MKPERTMTELVAAIRGGDQDAFTELYNRTSQEVYRSARAVLRDEDEALDVQQDTFVYAYQHLDQLSDPEKLRPWLRSIAMNRAKSVLRRNTPVLFTELENDEGEGLPEQADLSLDASPELSLERKETAELVNEILGELSDGQRAAIAMYYYEQMTASEIADALGVATGTVKSQLARGKKKIEDAVHALEKQGVKLYGLSPVGFLVALMKKQAPTAQAGQAVLAKTLASAGLSAGAKTAAAAGAGAAAVPVAETMVLHATRPFFSTVVGKLVLGVLCAGVVGGGVAGYNWAKDKLAPKVSPILYVDSAENLTKDPTTPTLPVELNPEDLTAPTLPLELETDAPTEPSVPETTEPAVTEPAETLASGSCGENLTWKLDSSGLLTIEGSGAMEDYLDHKSQSERVAPWAGDSFRIASVSLPDGLTSIGDYAFQGCTNLTRVTIPDSVTRIGASAFYDCESLASVKLGNGVSSIEAEAFYTCTSLASITIPDSVTRIGAHTFQSCIALERLTIGSGVTSIGEDAFYSCGSLTNVTIPASVTEIGMGAFADCNALQSIRVASGNPNYSAPNGVLIDDAHAALLLYPCLKSGEHYQIPDGVKSIGVSAFSGAPLTSVTIPDSVTEIGDSAFSGCKHLTSVTIPNAVTNVGNSAFCDCSGLTELTLSDSLTSIGDYAFYGCKGLERVTIPNEVTNVGAYAFQGCSALTELTLSESLTRIGNHAFCVCRALTSVTIPDGVTAIEANTFEACTALSEVTIPDSVTSIGESAFVSCKSLKTVYIPGSVTSIGTFGVGYNYDGEVNRLCTIHGEAGSAARDYAVANGIRFVAE